MTEKFSPSEQWATAEVGVRHLCVTCRYSKPNPPPGLPMACFHPHSRRDPVYGQVDSCQVMRAAGEPCGPNGRYWDQRPPAPRRKPTFQRVIRWWKGNRV